MRFLILRPLEQGQETAEALAGLGHEGIVAPLLRIIPNESALAELERLRPVVRLILTSANGLAFLPATPDWLAEIPIDCVGEATATLAAAKGFAHPRGLGGNAQMLLAALLAEPAPKGHVVHLAGRDRRGEITEELARAGWSAAALETYRAEISESLPDHIIRMITDQQFDGVIVTSPRMAEAFAAILVRDLQSVEIPPVLAISPATAQPLLTRAGQKVSIAREPTMASIFQLILHHP